MMLLIILNMINFEYDNITSELIIQDFLSYESNKKYDLILTNTCLEHVKDDAMFINKCNSYLQTNGKVIHIIPSNWGLYLFLWHGYRQYNKRLLKKLFCEMPSKIYRLGGLFSFWSHLILITVPNLKVYFKNGKGNLPLEQFRKTKAYDILIRICCQLDRLFPIFSHYYIVIINK